MTPTAAVSSTPEKAATISSATVPQKSATVSEKSATTSTASVKTYSVKVGDWLAKIAERQHLSGGWQKLYSDNRQAIGSDPSLIHPASLTIGERAVSTDDAKPSTKSFTQLSATTSTRSSARSATGSSGAADATKAQAAAPRATGAATNTGYTLPVEGATISATKVACSMWSSGYHTGVDFVVPTGTTVKAIAAGTVVSAGWGGAYGNQVVVQHADEPVLAVRPPVRPVRLDRPDRDREPADRPLRRDRQRRPVRTACTSRSAPPRTTARTWTRSRTCARTVSPSADARRAPHVFEGRTPRSRESQPCVAAPPSRPAHRSRRLRRGLGQWVAELQDGGTVTASHGVLEIDVPSGATVWFKQRLEGPYAIEYTATPVSEGGVNDRVSDLDFWNAVDVRSPDDLFATPRGGALAEYDYLKTYYVGYGSGPHRALPDRGLPGVAAVQPLLKEPYSGFGHTLRVGLSHHPSTPSYGRVAHIER